MPGKKIAWRDRHGLGNGVAGLGKIIPGFWKGERWRLPEVLSRLGRTGQESAGKRRVRVLGLVEDCCMRGDFDFLGSGWYRLSPQHWHWRASTAIQPTDEDVRSVAPKERPTF